MGKYDKIKGSQPWDGTTPEDWSGQWSDDQLSGYEAWQNEIITPLEFKDEIITHTQALAENAAEIQYDAEIQRRGLPKGFL